MKIYSRIQIMTKQKLIYVRKQVIFAVLGMFLLVEPAYAYLDPGTGSLIIQVLIASLVSLIFAIKVFWKKITNYFRNFSSKENHDQDENE